jgi:Sulfotransferase family
MAVHFPNIPATFIHVPKTGGTSFYTWISKNVTNFKQQANNNYAEGSVDGATAQWGELGTVFSFVRNPYSRLVSMYEYHYNKAKEHLDRHKQDPNAKLPVSIIDYLQTIAISKKGFDYWVTALCNGSEELFKINDANPKQITVTSWYNNKLPDIIIKTEDLNQEFYKIQNLLVKNCNDPLPWVNVTKHKPYREYYNSDTRKLVAERFKEDLDNFNYDF